MLGSKEAGYEVSNCIRFCRLLAGGKIVFNLWTDNRWDRESYLTCCRQSEVYTLSLRRYTSVYHFQVHLSVLKVHLSVDSSLFESNKLEWFRLCERISNLVSDRVKSHPKFLGSPAAIRVSRSECNNVVFVSWISNILLKRYHLNIHFM